MRPRFRPSSLVPTGLIGDHLDVGADRIGLVVRSGAAVTACPNCRTPSRRSQSRYRRRAAGLPLGGRRVEPQVVVRRFRCDAATCERKIFAERFPDGFLPAFARRTSRLEQIVHHLGLALGGRPGAGLAQRLMLPVSRDTLLRVIRRRAATWSDPLAVIGIDDFAWRRNHRYGTLVCDLERRRIVALLPDREQATAQTWLKETTSIQIVARDRGGGYGEAIARALPQAIQVADRWHLIENASRGFLDAVRKSMRQVREVVGAATLDPALLAAAERIQYEDDLRREEADAAIRALAEAGIPNSSRLSGAADIPVLDPHASTPARNGPHSFNARHGRAEGATVHSRGADTRAASAREALSEGVANVAIGHQLGQMIFEAGDPSPLPAGSIA